MKPILHCTFDPFFLREVLEADFAEPLTIWIDRVEGAAPGRNVLILMEPDPISRLREKIAAGHTSYEHVFTFDEVLLARLGNAVRFEFGTTWAADYEPGEKVFGVSTVYGDKRLLEGHRLRGEIFRRRREIRAPRRFFVSGRPRSRLSWRLATAFARRTDCAVLGGSKAPLFATQFHVAIENCRVANYFSEKVIDCFVTRTVPLYWGCPNIDAFFDLDGMILFDTADELIARANRLTPDDYDRRRPAIEGNLARARDYAEYGPRLLRRLRQLGYR